MALSIGRNSSALGTALGVVVAAIAIVGTRFFGWEWGADQLVPTMVGGLAAAVAVALVFLRYRD